MISEIEIFRQLSEIIAKSLRVDSERITPDAHIMNDLGAESLDMIEITMEVEAVFNICLPEKSILDIAIEVFGPGVLAVEDRLTQTGKQLLRHRLGAEEADALEGEVRMKDLRSSLMTVRAWTRMIKHLAEHTPTTCDSCGSGLKPDLGSRMICTSCSRTFVLRSGEEINRDWVKQYYSSVYLPSVGQSAATANSVATSAS